MNNRNYGSYSSRNFSPPRSNHSNDYRNQFRSDQEFYQYQNNLQPSQYERNYNNESQNYQRKSRFDDYPQREQQQQSFSDANYISFTDRQLQNYDDRPKRENSRFERDQNHQLRNNQHDSNYDQRRSIQNSQREAPRTSTQQNNQQSRMNLKFPDVFTVSRRNEDGVTTYNCNLCNLSNLPENNLQTHVTGKRHQHQVKMQQTGGKSNDNKPKMSQFRPSGNKMLYTHRPSFDGIVGPVTHPLIALTYIVEILDPTVKEPSYVCVLCSKRCDPRTIVHHLISQTHRMNYLERHFPHLITILHNSRRFNEDMEFRNLVLINVSKVLEDSFGRATAFVYDGSDYETTKEIIFDNIIKKKHITQDDIPDVENVLLEGISFDSTTWEMNNPPKAPMINNESPGKKRKLTEKIIEAYKSELNIAMKELEKKLLDYQRDPESHPFYKKEWELFWNRKVDEVTARGGDIKNYNFQSEWCDFFLDRIKDLHREEVKWKTEQLRRKFSITPADIKEIEEKNNPKRRRNSEEYFRDRKGRFNNDRSDDDDDDEDYTIDTPRIDKADLYVKEKRIFDNFLTNLNPVGKEKTQNLQASSSRAFKNKEVPSSQNQNDSTTLITTLRLLSSLESELGLLAPRVLELLSKSLAYERENPKKSDDLLFDSENLNLVETVKEKILGMQAANLIASNKQIAVQKAINEVEKLIKKHEKIVKNRSGNNFNYDQGNNRKRNIKQAMNRLRQQN